MQHHGISSEHHGSPRLGPVQELWTTKCFRSSYWFDQDIMKCQDSSTPVGSKLRDTPAKWGVYYSGIQTPVYIHHSFCCCSSSFISYVAKMMECSGAIWRHHLHPSPHSILKHVNSTSIFRPMKIATLNVGSISSIFFLPGRFLWRITPSLQTSNKMSNKNCSFLSCPRFLVPYTHILYTYRICTYICLTISGFSCRYIYI